METSAQGIGGKGLWTRLCQWRLVAWLVMRWWRSAMLIVLVTGCAGTGFAEKPADPGPERIEVIEVIDGDSLLVGRRSGRLEVRLVGVNAPEIGECHHAEARQGLVTMLDDSVVTLSVEGTDRFGRVLGRLEVDGSDASLGLVRAGHGLALVSASDSDRLIEAEEAAYGQGLGMWAPDCRLRSGPAVGFDAASSVPDPPGDEREHLDAEIVVVVNFGEEPVDLGGWQLRDGSSRHRFRFPESSVLDPMSRITVSSSSADWVPGGGPVWSNSGDVALLLDDSGRVVSRWRYRPPSG